MKWREIIKKIKKIHYTEGVRKNEYTIWNCPCTGKERHPLGIGLHLTEECRLGNFKKQLGPHAKEIGL